MQSRSLTLLQEAPACIQNSSVCQDVTHALALYVRIDICASGQCVWSTRKGPFILSNTTKDLSSKL